MCRPWTLLVGFLALGMFSGCGPSPQGIRDAFITSDPVLKAKGDVYFHRAMLVFLTAGGQLEQGAVGAFMDDPSPRQTFAQILIDRLNRTAGLPDDRREAAIRDLERLDREF